MHERGSMTWGTAMRESQLLSHQATVMALALLFSTQ
jgi:hypothetical protein